MKQKKLFLSAIALALTISAGASGIVRATSQAAQVAQAETPTVATVERKAQNLSDTSATEVEVTTNTYDLATAYTTGNNNSGLGYGFNLITNDYFNLNEIRSGAPILEEDFRQEKINSAVYMETGQAITKYCSDYKKTTMASEMSSAWGIDTSISGGVSIFSGELESSYTAFEKGTNLTSSSDYYYRLHSELSRYTCSLPSISNLALYKSNLDPVFQTQILALLEEDVTTSEVDNFFNTYGTHIIMKGIYGGKVDMYYHASASTHDLGRAYRESFDESFELKFASVIGVEASFSYDISEIVNTTSEDSQEEFWFRCIGGNAFSTMSLTGFSQNYTTWLNSIEGNESLVGMPTDGLKGLWQLLPSGYDTTENSEKIRSLYVQYAQRNTVTYTDDTTLFVPEKNSTYLLRKDERTITDSGRFKHNVYDVLNFRNEYGGYGLSYAKGAGYTRIEITVFMHIREVNKGYQYIFLYKNPDQETGDEGNNKDTHYITEAQYEYGGTDKITEYSTEPIQFSFNCSIDDFMADSLLVIRYGASGSDEDTWVNKEITVEIKLQY